MDEYAKTKFRIFENQDENDLAILNFDDQFTQKHKNFICANKKYFSLKVKKNIILQNNFLHFSSKNIPLKDAILKGPHNVENMMATILTLENLKISEDVFKMAFQTFSPLAHRLEFVENIDGISFFNDSKATNTDSVKYALQSFDKPIRLIIGGAGKNEDYTVLNHLIKKYVKKIYIIGADRFKMKKAFANTVKLELFDDFQNGITKAFSEAQKDDVILLSPACTSYDMFQNFEERGNFFKKIVRNLRK